MRARAPAFSSGNAVPEAGEAEESVLQAAQAEIQLLQEQLAEEKEKVRIARQHLPEPYQRLLQQKEALESKLAMVPDLTPLYMEIRDLRAALAAALARTENSK